MFKTLFCVFVVVIVVLPVRAGQDRGWLDLSCKLMKVLPRNQHDPNVLLFMRLH